MDHNDTIYMQRAIQLAQLSTKDIRSNPSVGAVLVFDNKIIGEGYHQKYGEGHAEVNCIKSVSSINKKHLSKSTLYVTLEPCSHYGKTPPCAELIIAHQIPRVVIGIVDPNPKVAGKGIEILRSQGIDVNIGVCSPKCQNLILPFLKMLNYQRPWILLKFAKSKYNYMASPDQQVWLSQHHTRIHTHRQRADVDAILIGTGTTITDNPKLNTRYIDGDDPMRIVLDRTGKIASETQMLSDGLPTIYVTESERILDKQIIQIKLDFSEENHLITLLKILYDMGYCRILVEGGPTLLKSFVNQNLWDEAMIINTDHPLNEGLKAPHLSGTKFKEYEISGDSIEYILR